MTIRPALKSGITVRNQETNEIRIGSRWRFFTLPSQWHGVETEALLRLFNGKSTLIEITSTTGLDVADLESLIRELRAHDLVDLGRTPVAYLRRYNPELGRIEEVSDLDQVAGDVAVETALKRIETECDAVTFTPGDVDGGRTSILNRRSFQVVIFGHGKIVNALVGVLSASGFSKLNVINRVGTRDSSLKILEGDIAGGYVTRSHFGQQRKSIVDEIRSNSLLFVEPKTQINNPDLIISIGTPSPDSIQRWMVENTTHLLVDIPSSAEIRIGPLVIPGKSPCFRCVQLSESSQPLTSQSSEPSAALALSVAGAIALDVIALADRKRSAYLSTSHIHTVRDYTTPQIQHWSQHHACGCSWEG